MAAVTVVVTVLAGCVTMMVAVEVAGLHSLELVDVDDVSPDVVVVVEVEIEVDVVDVVVPVALVAIQEQALDTLDAVSEQALAKVGRGALHDATAV